MQIPILIEPIANGFRARGAEPFALIAEGDTKEDALAKLNEQLRTRLQAGAAIVSLEIPDVPRSLTSFIGTLKDDPWIDDWKQSMAEYRKTIDEDPDAL